ncbi:MULTISPECIES: AAA family ATPase [Enterobacter cloacae complex]|uniref:AAA family ATPase n=1 Tax=Enterobacter cloacae complex TaxID=354276 RepID=UPI000D70274E|nr:AAA family ATPase [Enterobacter hormaechei]WMA94718.1 AAA family ATPase [Enterobacter hormaechei]WMB07910.1 AAA family ATPase [Enterobacter hormaechei]HDV8231591.1 AAA family ATPase [Enterobacter hormaechei]
MAKRVKTDKPQNLSYRIKSINIEKLKGINNCPISFPEDKSVTAIMGINGSGKSTILHALSCVFKPLEKSSKENNRFSDFFTPHNENNWQDSKFSVVFRAGEIKYNGGTVSFEGIAIDDKKDIIYGKDKRWTPVYARRLERESIYIGLQNLATLADNTGASRYAEYKRVDIYEKTIKDKMILALNKILDADYKDLFECHTLKGNKKFIGMVKGDIEYTEHTMGAGEKRVFEIVKHVYSGKLNRNGYLIIDEIDVLLHERAFQELISFLIKESKAMCFEVVFTTHRESVINFKNQINIISIWNIGNGIEAYPGVSADALRQITDVEPDMVNVFVEDNLAKTAINILIESEGLNDKVDISLFGSAENSAVILSGLKLTEKRIDTSLAILDGDYYITPLEKTKMVNKVLSGTDKRVEKEEVLSRIFQFNLDITDVKGSPEKNHRLWFEAIDENGVTDNDKTMFVNLKKHSQSIGALTDYHDYYPELARRARLDNIEYKVLNFISKYSEKWDFYIRDIRVEIHKAIALI